MYILPYLPKYMLNIFHNNSKIESHLIIAHNITCVCICESWRLWWSVILYAWSS